MGGGAERKKQNRYVFATPMKRGRIGVAATARRAFNAEIRKGKGPLETSSFAPGRT